jgi:putative peptidoglycan lipid II flippase
VETPATQQTRRIALNTVIFSIATGLSRIAASSGKWSRRATSAPRSVLGLHDRVPGPEPDPRAGGGLALSAAFVPVFTELLEQRKRKEAFELAGALFGLILVVLGAITVVFILVAPWVIPLLTGSEFTPQLDELTVGLSRVLFPIVLLLGLNGLVVGILNAYDHFAIPAISPVVWNLVIIVGLVALKPLFHGPNQVYAYAIAIVLGTIAQFAMCLPVLKRVGFHLHISFHWRDPRIRTVLVLMLPVTLGLGLINFDALINSSLGSLVSESAPAAIDRAFRLYMLPQGIFSVAVATVLFPALSRFAARGDYDGLRRTSGNGVRQIACLLIPAAVFTAVLAEPLTRLVYQRGEFGASSTDEVSEALFWFSFSLPFSGANLLLTRTFFSLRARGSRPRWRRVAARQPRRLAGALPPLGIAGIVIGPRWRARR